MKRVVAVLVAAMLIASSGMAQDSQTDDLRVYRNACQAYSDGHYAIAFRDLMPFAARGDPWSQFAVAEMLRSGNGTRRNREEALVWYRRAAEQDYAPAQCNLGTSLYFGWGTPADPQAALDWWLRAALNRDEHAMFNLGTVIARGRYVERDFVRAYRWLREASVLGYAPADDVLATLRKVMTSDQIYRAETMSLYEAMNFSRRQRPPE